MLRLYRLSAGLLLAILIAASSGTGARADDRSDVLKANQAFDDAVSARDIAGLQKVSAQDAGVTLIGPSDKVPVVGADAVRKNWADGAFVRFSELSITLTNPNVRILGDTAILVGTEVVHGKRASDGKPVAFSALATNVFEKHAGHWLLVHHHASRVPQ